MARSRKDAWLRDELILALDLYLRKGTQASREEQQELSEVLRAMPIERHLSADPKFRSRQAVSYKLHNFVAVDPNQATAGFPHIGQGDADVWDDFADRPDELAKAAQAIRANLTELTPVEAEAPDDAVPDAPEGRILTRTHRVRERNRRLVNRKKARAFAAHDKLACEACGFDFALTYGERGMNFIECHHTVALRDLKPGARTKLDDLAPYRSSTRVLPDSRPDSDGAGILWW